jgi:hypothetical protein
MVLITLKIVPPFENFGKTLDITSKTNETTFKKLLSRWNFPNWLLMQIQNFHLNLEVYQIYFLYINLRDKSEI